MKFPCRPDFRSSRVLLALLAGILLALPIRAEVILIDIGPAGFDLEGINGGLGPVSGGLFKDIHDFPVSGSEGGSLFVGAEPAEIGLTGYDGLAFASGSGHATPTRLGGGAVIDGSLDFIESGNASEFLFGGAVSPDFGSGSYMAFSLTGDLGTYYGYFEITWTSALNEFQILSAAYESTPDVPIVAPVPEPSIVVLLGLAAVAFVVLRRRTSLEKSRAQPRASRSFSSSFSCWW